MIWAAHPSGLNNSLLPFFRTGPEGGDDRGTGEERPVACQRITE
jgi:hypothetical protein